ncbi:MAG: EFR1 family ferrodoxin [Clostridiales Family XIII bacterium]|jgi:ferredoxin|nr:EFR1 family ferrodoxin [Clostridiales Family XIII bacterium]
MKPDNVTAAYFSGTGTTEKIVRLIAGRLAEHLGAAPDFHDFTLPASREDVREFCPQDMVVLGVPTYAGRVPNVLLPYLTEKLVGGGALALPVVLFGNRDYDDSLIELRNILEADGFYTVGGAAFAGEHSFSYVLGAGRPDAEDLARAAGFADTVFDRVSALTGVPAEPAFVKGEEPLRPYYTPRDRHGAPVNILKVKPKVNEDCTDCGICAEVCPMGSINPQNVREYTGICIKCGACIKKCPEKARYYDDEGFLYHKTELEEVYVRRAEPELF